MWWLERTLRHSKWKKQVAEQYVDYYIIHILKSPIYTSRYDFAHTFAYDYLEKIMKNYTQTDEGYLWNEEWNLKSGDIEWNLCFYLSCLNIVQ